MKWDVLGLPVKDNDYVGESCKDLAIYFIDIFFFRKMFQRDFKIQHPQRPQAEGESVEDYDNYLNQHVSAYRDLLKNQDIEYMEDADLHLADKLTGLMPIDNKIIIHPNLGFFNNTLNLLPMMVCLNLYDFDEYTNQDSNNISILNIKNKRNKPLLCYVADIYRLFCIPIWNNPEVHICDLLYAKHKNPTIISNLATKLFFTKYKNFGNIKAPTIKWLTTTE